MCVYIKLHDTNQLKKLSEKGGLVSYLVENSKYRYCFLQQGSLGLYILKSLHWGCMRKSVNNICEQQRYRLDALMCGLISTFVFAPQTLSISEISCLQPSSVVVEAGLCLTQWELGNPEDKVSPVKAQGRLCLCCPLTGMTLSEPYYEKTCCQGFQPDLTQARHRGCTCIETWNFRHRNKRD